MAKTSNAGRQSIFREKSGGDRVQGLLTKAGSSRFELARARLARLVGRDVNAVSDADTIEYLARGDRETRDYLRGVL